MTELNKSTRYVRQFMAQDRLIRIPRAFVSRVRFHVRVNAGEPLLEYRQPFYLATVYACKWDSAEFRLQTVPDEPDIPWHTLREYLAWKELDADEWLAERPGLDHDDLDREAPAAWCDPYDHGLDVTGPVFYRFERVGVDGVYVVDETDEVIGEVKMYDGPAPGNDFRGVDATNAVVLSCLQYRLDELRTPFRIELGSV